MPRRTSAVSRNATAGQSKKKRAVATAPLPPRRTALRLTLHAEAGKRYAPFLKRHLLTAHQLLAPTLEDLTVVLAADARMRQLHQRFMNLDTPTDVLTFPLDRDEAGRDVSGELVICVDEAARRAPEHGTTVSNELLLYALHGMLHLCGFDDRTKAGFKRMHRKEDEILVQLGIGPVFGMADARASRAPAWRRAPRATPRSASRPAATKRRPRAADLIVGAD